MFSGITSSSSSVLFGSFDSRMSGQIANDISSGKISQTDGKALASALSDISSALNSESSKTASSSRFDPKKFQAKLESLIDDEVKSGKLTSDQAKELKSLLSPKSAGHTLNIPVNTSGQVDVKSDNDGDDQNSTQDASAKPSSANDALQDFLKLLQDAQTQLQKAKYNSAGAQAPSTSNDPLLLDRSA